MPTLPTGWSRPLKASEVETLFPMAAAVVWYGPPHRPEAGRLPVVWLRWEPESARDQPVLTPWAVPSSQRQAIRRAIRGEVGDQAARWFADVVHRSDVSRSLPHDVVWFWDGASMKGEASGGW